MLAFMMTRRLFDIVGRYGRRNMLPTPTSTRTLARFARSVANTCLGLARSLTHTLARFARSEAPTLATARTLAVADHAPCMWLVNARWHKDAPLAFASGALATLALLDGVSVYHDGFQHDSLWGELLHVGFQHGFHDRWAKTTYHCYALLVVSHRNIVVSI